MPPPPPPPPHHRSVSYSIVLPPLSAAAAFFSFILVFSVCFRKISRKRTVPTDLSKPPHRFSYSALRRATNSFSPSLRLGQGGFGSVYRATLPKNHVVAVKVMESGVSLQGEREFQNELLFASKLDSPQLTTAIGFSSDRKHRTIVLIYELMPNGNLQDAVLHKKCPELKEWKKRFSIAIDIAKGIEYLHSLQPPVIHGDIKPSNILLDQYFSAKIADFGLSWVRTESDQNNNGGAAATNDNSNQGEVKIDIGSINGGGGTECGSVVMESESVSVTTAGFEDFNFGVDHSPESTLRLQEMADGVTVALPEGNLDVESVGSAKKDDSRKDSRGKQDNDVSGAGEGEDGVKVKDYVMQWIGTEVKQERPLRDWIDGGASSSASAQVSGKTIEKKKKKKKTKNKMHKRLDWWISLDDEKEEKVLKKESRRQPREWWKEEYCEELEKKRRKKKKKDLEMGVSNAYNSGGEDYWPRDADLYSIREEKRRSGKSRGSKGSMDWFSGELFRGRHNSRDSFSGEIPMSGGISSTPSMRGTVCYVAPEYGGGAGDLSEKSDVYSFGVLLLVLIAGRRPLQVTNSPMREYQRANLIHWARQLARTGKLIDLVDQSVHSIDREQVELCITVALLCLQKSPSRRPSMKDVVHMLTGESRAPQLPAEFSPSPPSHFPLRSKLHRKVR